MIMLTDIGPGCVHNAKHQHTHIQHTSNGAADLEECCHNARPNTAVVRRIAHSRGCRPQRCKPQALKRGRVQCQLDAQQRKGECSINRMHNKEGECSVNRMHNKERKSAVNRMHTHPRHIHHTHATLCPPCPATPLASRTHQAMRVPPSCCQ